MSDGRTYKAVFLCPVHDERQVWYVSSPHKGRKMMHAHICGYKKRLRKYRGMKEGVDFTLTVIPMFDTLPDVGVIDTSS